MILPPPLHPRSIDRECLLPSQRVVALPVFPLRWTVINLTLTACDEIALCTRKTWLKHWGIKIKLIPPKRQRCPAREEFCLACSCNDLSHIRPSGCASISSSHLSCLAQISMQAFSYLPFSGESTSELSYIMISISFSHISNLPLILDYLFAISIDFTCLPFMLNEYPKVQPYLPTVCNTLA